MPLVASACLLYAIGLLAGGTLGNDVAAGFAATLLLVTAIHITRRRADAMGAAMCLVLGVAGILVAVGARRVTDTCAHEATHASALHVRLEDDAVPGALAHSRVQGNSCTLPATLFVTRGGARAGDAAVVRGTATSSARGLLVRDADVSDVRHGASLAAVRERVGRRIDRIFAGDAPLVRALVIADMSAIPAEQRDRFARAGLVHMLSVSGLHVAIVALALELLAAALRLPRGPAGIGTITLLAGYVLLIGAPPPAVRAAVMLGIVLATRLLQRPTSRWAIVAVGSTVPLIDPSVVLDLGWQLSVAGTIALVAGAALARRVLPRAWRGMRRGFATAAVVSIVATLVTAPLVAWTFGQLAVLGPVTNLLADPVMGLLQPVLFLALCLPVQGAERVLADAAHALILAFNGIATVAASLPFAVPLVLPSALAALAGAVASVAFVCACMAREWARPVGVALVAIAVMTLEPMAHLRRPMTELHMIDVGQGDAIALRTRAGRWVLVDAGRSWRGGDAGRSTVVPYVAHRGGTVALFLMSHPHADHVGGAASVLDALHPSAFLDPGYAGGSAPYLAALAAARRDRIPWHRVHPGDSVVVDEAVITALAPDSAWASRLADANLASAVVMIRIGGVRVLLTGDAEAAEEDWLLAHAPDALAADVLKVAHHGSATSTTPAFLSAVRPRLALVSVGAGNTYGHPSASVMDALRRSGAEVLRTDRLGTVVVRTEGRVLDVEARGLRWTVGARPAH